MVRCQNLKRKEFAVNVLILSFVFHRGVFKMSKKNYYILSEGILKRKENTIYFVNEKGKNQSQSIKYIQFMHMVR